MFRKFWHRCVGGEGLRAPCAQKGCTIEPLTDRSPSVQSGEVGFHRARHCPRTNDGQRLAVDKDQPVRLLAYTGLTTRNLITADLAQRGPVTFSCDQPFFI